MNSWIAAAIDINLEVTTKEKSLVNKNLEIIPLNKDKIKASLTNNKGNKIQFLL